MTTPQAYELGTALGQGITAIIIVIAAIILLFIVLEIIKIAQLSSISRKLENISCDTEDITHQLEDVLDALGEKKPTKPPVFEIKEKDDRNNNE